jgi:hypothetical protein
VVGAVFAVVSCFAALGFVLLCFFTHGQRHGLHSSAVSRLNLLLTEKLRF